MNIKEINFREGVVKWFKGYNSKKKIENDYGFILDSELSREIYFHESQVKDINLDLKEKAGNIIKGLKGQNLI